MSYNQTPCPKHGDTSSCISSSIIFYYSPTRSSCNAALHGGDKSVILKSQPSPLFPTHLDPLIHSRSLSRDLSNLDPDPQLHISNNNSLPPNSQTHLDHCPQIPLWHSSHRFPRPHLSAHLPQNRQSRLEQVHFRIQLPSNPLQQ